MKKLQLTTEILKFIYNNLLIFTFNEIEISNSVSILNTNFLLKDKITFIDDETNEEKGNIWGCELSSLQNKLKILVGDCSDNNIKAYVVLVQLEGSPAYGLYLDELLEEPLIACYFNDLWMECSVCLQASFLAGMEQVRETGLSWVKCSDYKKQKEILLSFINYHNELYEADYEG